MTYNLHPIFVHFPIALLFIYSVIKILPLNKWFPTVAWKHIERVFLFFGILGAFAALLTGETAEHLTRPNRNLVENHSLFATISTWIYSLILVGDILSMTMPWIISKLKSGKIIKISIFIKDILINPIISTILAILGLITISIAGLLGGVMIYGTSSDPLAGIVLKILGITL